MISSSDIEYKKTKLIKQGLNRIDKKFERLAEWISEKYKVNVLDIQEEFMKHNSKVRVAIHLETHRDAMVFGEGEHWVCNFDSVKQNEIAKKYIEIGNLLKVPKKGVLENILKRNPNVNEIFVSFSAFEPIAREEVNGLIPENRIEELHKKLNIPEIWTISRCFESATLFVYKDDQKEKIKNSAEFKIIEDNYFKLLKEFDEFDYWKRKNFGIGIDSKQNFDDNFMSNWYYYYK